MLASRSRANIKTDAKADGYPDPPFGGAGVSGPKGSGAKIFIGEQGNFRSPFVMAGSVLHFGGEQRIHVG
jgi:hypothetical protein